MLNAHQSVLLEEVIKYLNPSRGESFLDATAGYGGHAESIIRLVGPEGKAVLIDRDAQAIQALRDQFGASVMIQLGDYATILQQLAATGEQFDMILFDLGVSSPQLDKIERGFSFQLKAKLDMRMDTRQELTADTVVNTYDLRRLTEILTNYGEEPKAKQVASAILRSRPIHSTKELAGIVRKATGYRPGRTHAATRTFQAIRIEVNDELRQLEAALPTAVKLLKTGGRLAVISFHSLEDKIVKQFFQQESRDCICPPAQPVCTCDHVATLKLVKTKPVRGAQEIVFNPRARSAKLRVACKIKTKKGGVRDSSRQKLL